MLFICFLRYLSILSPYLKSKNPIKENLSPLEIKENRIKIKILSSKIPHEIAAILKGKGVNPPIRTNSHP